jgi:transposase InsO family protein
MSPTPPNPGSLGARGDKTELISDRVWRTREQLEFAIVEYVAWFNHVRLHSSLGDIPPVEFEALYAPQYSEKYT